MKRTTTITIINITITTISYHTVLHTAPNTIIVSFLGNSSNSTH